MYPQSQGIAKLACDCGLGKTLTMHVVTTKQNSF